MARQIIKQPNGKLALWSTIVDDFILVDADESELVEFLVEEEREKTAKHVREVVAELDRGGRPYYQFTKSFAECIREIREHHGAETKSLKLLGQIQ